MGPLGTAAPGPAGAGPEGVRGPDRVRPALMGAEQGDCQGISIFGKDVFPLELFLKTFQNKKDQQQPVLKLFILFSVFINGITWQINFIVPVYTSPAFVKLDLIE